MSTILIIDDDDQLRISFERLLKEEGYAVRTAASGEAGLRMVSETIPDLVLLDVRLPGMNGLETFRQIHQHRAEAAGDHHDRLRHHGDGHRSHQNGRLRLCDQAL